MGRHSAKSVDILEKYKKVVIGSFGVIGSALAAAIIGDGALSFAEFVNVAVLGAGTISVGIAPNTPGSKYVKAILAGLTAALTVLLSVYTGGVTPTEWVQIGIAVFNAAGIYKFPNKGDTLDRMLKDVKLQKVPGQNVSGSSFL